MLKKYFPIALFLSASIVACGGSNSEPRFDRMVVFGDSLTDQGNYKSVADSLGATGAGRFTTNPDLMWVEHTAAVLGLQIKARADGGFNYAEGFARNKLAAPPQPGLSQLPIDQQVSLFTSKNQFTAKDAVFINGGGNDVLLAALGNTGTPTLDQAAIDFAAIIKQLSTAGAKNIYVLRTPDLGVAPVGGSGAGGSNNPLTQLVSHYNGKVAQEIGLTGVQVTYVDSFTFIGDMFKNPAKYGLTDVTTPGCSNGDFASFACTRAQQNPKASQEFLMADKIHLAGKAQKLLGEYVASIVSPK